MFRKEQKPDNQANAAVFHVLKAVEQVDSIDAYHQKRNRKPSLHSQLIQNHAKQYPPTKNNPRHII